MSHDKKRKKEKAELVVAPGAWIGAIALIPNVDTLSPKDAKNYEKMKALFDQALKLAEKLSSSFDTASRGSNDRVYIHREYTEKQVTDENLLFRNAFQALKIVDDLTNE